MDKLVSIIMPVYNTEKILLENSVKSILGQRYGFFELLVIDDGSDNDVHFLCDSLHEVDYRVRVFHLPNGGVSRARNFGLEKAEGEFITFVDSDDSVSPTYIENLVNAWKNTGASYIKCGAVRVYSTSLSIKPSVCNSSVKVSRSRAFDDICFLKRPYPGIEITAVWGSLYSREIIGDTRFRSDTVIGEDFIFNCEIIGKTEEIVYLQTEDYGYYINQDGAMAGCYSRKKGSSVDGFRKFISEYGGENESSDEIINRLVNIAIVIFIMIPNGHEYKDDKENVVAFIREYRSAVIRNKKTRFKVRTALLISYVSFDLIRCLYGR